MSFQTIVADPPWKYNDKMQSGNSGFGKAKLTRGAANHYDVLPTAAIMAMGGNGQIAGFPVADNAHLYMWTTNAFLVEAHEIMRAWGFTQKTMLTWAKPQIGMGYYFRNNTEHVLFGVRGKLPLSRRNAPTLFTAKRLKHSEKPLAFFDLVESCSPGPYLELFARQPRDGWVTWGNELPEEVSA